MVDPAAGPEPGRRRPRWGLRTLGFLVLAFLALGESMALGHHTVGTLGCLILGLAGATYCSLRGVRSARERGMYGLLMDRRTRR